ncbi:response regulator [Desertivirga brevis]|uniref:response regulator n=1 Tax=Desertivirga brevis TaxID=2810310 RepID=UPI001A95FD18|nr:response regulator [Pedobacter sp. SYSU D00873]
MFAFQSKIELANPKAVSKRILIVDDNEDILDTLILILTIEGYELYTALSPEKIEEDIKGFLPDLIMLDIQMGDYDGLDVCRDVKSNEKTCEIPIMIVSSHERIEKAIPEYGANAILRKPFEVNELLCQIKSFFPEANEQMMDA